MVVWYAGAIIGASADTMAEENLKGGCRRLGDMFSAPPQRTIIIFAAGGAIAHDNRPAS
jgi:hypothetical protein